MELREFFAQHPKTALAFSGGADSAYLLYAGLSCGAEVRAYYVKSPFQPEFELRDAVRLCRELGAELTVIPLELLTMPAIAANPPERCYHCKKLIMGAVKARAGEDGLQTVIDGTNFSDDAGDRPGMRALCEGGILSPLRECSLTKPEIRRLSREAGLFTWDKPAYACLATRIPTGEEITAEKLQKAERAEEQLFEMGFKDFRVRLRGDSALLQFAREELPEASLRLEEIEGRLSGLFPTVRLDNTGRTKGL